MLCASMKKVSSDMRLLPVRLAVCDELPVPVPASIDDEDGEDDEEAEDDDEDDEGDKAWFRPHPSKRVE